MEWIYVSQFEDKRSEVIGKFCIFAALFVFFEYCKMITDDLDLALREATALYHPEQLYVLVDTHTRQFCLPAVEQTLRLLPEHVLCIESGEDQKTLATIERIWDFLTENGATRFSLLLILGGGVLTDMGGFAASTFKRGIRYVNIPTTLLAAVDAATGGKTGFDYHGLKNEIGLFCTPERTIVYPAYLQTLPHKEFLSGYAEMLKHALIASPLEVAQILSIDMDNIDWTHLTALLARSIDIKNYIVEQDPSEEGLRKTLNFGHTIGHALESLSFTSDQPMLHGYAVLYGMVAELYLSVIKLGFPRETLSQVVELMKSHYGRPVCPCRDYERLWTLMKHDKKNVSPEHVTFTLLRNVGNCRLNQSATKEEVFDALDFLFNQ